MAVPCAAIVRGFAEKNFLRRSLAFIAAYLITFCCYGSHLPGGQGAIDRDHNVPGTWLPDSRPNLCRHYETSLKQPPFEINAAQREITLEAIREVCHFKHWGLLAVHVRTNHVHTVVDPGIAVKPESVMNAFKSYASRALNRQASQRLRWARHGSTRYLRSSDEVKAAVRHVLEKQGEPMAHHSSAL